MALKELLTDLSKFKYTNYENVGANNSQIGGRHGGYEGGGEPPHPEEHSKFDDGVGGIGNPQTFTVRGHTVSDIISGRHGGTEGPTPAQPPHPDDHSIHDDGVGYGVAPNDSPQSFDVRGYTVTGNKRFYIGWQGDIMNHPLSDYGIGAFDSIAGVFDHTQTRDRLRKAYDNYDLIEFGSDGSVHVGNQDLAGVVGGGLNYYGSLVSITPRGSIFRDSSGNYQVPQEGKNTNPPGGISNIPLFDGTQITHNIPQIVLTGPLGDEDYQSTLNTTPKVLNAHGSDFMTTPLANYVSDFHPTYPTTVHTSGFNRDDMYIPGNTEPSIPDFKQFTRSDSALKRYNKDTLLEIGQFDGIKGVDNRVFEWPDTRPYNLVFKGVTSWAPMWTMDSVTGASSNIDVTLNSTQPYIVRQIGDRWGLYEGDPEDGGEHLSGAIEWANALSGEFFRAPLDVMIDRSVADIGRISKFLTSTRGALFLGKQFILQAFNPTIETKVYNPLSLGSAVPLIHVNRHAGGKRYTDVVPSDSAVQSLADLSPGVEIGPIGVSGADIINAGIEAVGYDVPSFGRVEMQSPLATIHGEKLPLDKRVALSNPNRFLWPGALGISTGTDAAISEASKIQKSQDIVLGRAKGQSDGGIKDLFQKISFNKYDGGSNVYLSSDGIMGTPEAEGPFGFLASLPISYSQLESQVTNALTNWATSTISGLFEDDPPSDWGNELEVEERQPPPHRFDLLEQTNPDIPISGPLLNSPLAAIMASYYPGMQGSYSFPTHISGDLWPVYGHDYQYPVTKGTTPLISGIKLDGPTWGVSLLKRVTGMDVGDQGEYSGRSYAELDKPILYDVNPFTTIDRAQGGYSITRGSQDSPITTIPYDGNYYDAEIEFVYQKNYNKGKLIPITGTQYGHGPGYGLAAMATAEDTFEQYDGTKDKLVWFRGYDENDEAIMEPPLALSSPITFDSKFGGNIYYDGKDGTDSPYWPKDRGLITSQQLTLSNLKTVNSKNDLPASNQIEFYGDDVGTRKTIGLDKITFGDRIKVANGFQGDLYGLFRNTAAYGTRKKYITDIGEPHEPIKVTYGVESDKSTLYIGHVGSIGAIYTQIHGLDNITPGERKPIVSKLEPSDTKNKFPSKIFGTEKHNQTIVSKAVYHGGGNIYSFDGSSYLKRLKNRFLYKGQLGHYSDKGELPTGGSGAGDTKFVSVGLGTDFQGDIFSHKDKDGGSTTVFDDDLYDKTNNYLKQLKDAKSRVGTDKEGDPTITIKTSHKESDPNVPRLNTVEGKYKTLEKIKLQDFPLINLQSGGNLGKEGQALGFVNKSGSPTKLSDNLYGPDDKISTKVGDDYKRKGFTKQSYQESIKGTEQTAGGAGDTITKGRFSVNESNIPQAVKRLSTTNDHMDSGVVIGDNTQESNIVQGIEERKESKAVGKGNILDRYKTLAYGEIPKHGDKNTEKNRYDKKTDKSPVTTHTTSLSTVAIVPDDELGLVKKTSDDKDGKYTTDLVDKVNMYQYGNGDIQDDADYIKFKIYDVVNSKYIIFRAFLSGISETLSPEWASERYIGRPDSVHVYQGVERSMSFEFMIVPSSKQELPILWEKMNYLVGLTYPTWKPLGTTGKRMESPFIQLTIGDMYNSVPGYFSSLGITVDDQSPWELDGGFQLPHAVNVACEFTHIGQHALASQGKHFDLPFLRKYDSTKEWAPENQNPQLGSRTGLKELMGEKFIASTLAG